MAAAVSVVFSSARTAAAAIVSAATAAVSSVSVTITVASRKFLDFTNKLFKQKLTPFYTLVTPSYCIYIINT